MKPEMKTHCVELYRDAPELHEVVLASEALAACAARDARIVELEGLLLDANARLNGPPVSEAKAQEPDCDRSACGDFSPGPCDNPDCSARRDRMVVAPAAKAQGVVMDGSQLAGLLEQVRLDDDEAKPHGSGATYWNNAVIACQVAIRDALAAPVQQVSVPDERIIPTSAELIQWAWEEEPEETRFQEGYNAAKRWVKMQIEAGIAAPAAPAADAWIQVSERLPDSGSTVIAYYLSSYGKGRAIRAQHVEAWTIEAEDVADVDTDCVEYSEQDDCYYLLQGWYECIDNWDEYYRVAVTEGPITHWMPLAAAPAQSTTEGQGDE